jgi:GntR family transcriptional regulator
MHPRKGGGNDPGVSVDARPKTTRNNRRPSRDEPTTSTASPRTRKQKHAGDTILRAPEPIAYRALAHELRERIYRGDYEDVPLPSEMALAEEYRLSRQTVRRAFHDLVSDGLVYRVRGKGTFVTARDTRYARSFGRLGTLDDLVQLGVDTDFEVREPLTLIDDGPISARLGDDSSRIWRAMFLRRHQERVVCRIRVYLPYRIGNALKDAPKLSGAQITSRVTVISLVQTLGYDIDSATQMITAIASTKELAKDLGCRVGIPLLHIERLYLDYRGKGLELAVSDYIPEHFQHRTDLGRRTIPETEGG